ncbi:MAG TPA: aminotransferase class V-fold PLP-dependent enzyme [Actinomycetota bacterium]|nr:aminotransferase class V-fold PLP-dependent enzyme [Actinomycetota bacterium]
MEELSPQELPEMPELMIAGPCELPDEDLALLGRQVIAHYGDVWTSLHNRVIDVLGKLLGTDDPPYLMPGSGTTALDATIMNLFEPGQRVVTASSGFFGSRLAQIARSHRLEVVEVPVEIGHAVDVGRLAEAAAGAHGILATHVETATGVRHPIEDIAAVARELGALCVIDGIASVGAELLDIDAMGIDAVVTSTQKGLGGPPGLGIAALGEGGRARVEARGEPPPSWYLDFRTWDWYRREWGAWHPHPVTMPTNLVLALGSSVERILATGLEAWVAERARLAARCRQGLTELGLESVPAPGVGANLVVAMYAEDPTAIQKHLLTQGIMISGGLDPLMGKAIRVGLMGRTATDEMIDRVLAGVAAALGR